MGLEAATYLNQLVALNPDGADPKYQGDNHIRLVKSVLQNSFPNISGAVTASHTELSYVTGVTSSIQAQFVALGANKANIFSPTFTGNPQAPNPAPGDNTASIATTFYVQQALGISSMAAADQTTLARTIRRARFAYNSLIG